MITTIDVSVLNEFWQTVILVSSAGHVSVGGHRPLATDLYGLRLKLVVINIFPNNYDPFVYIVSF